MKEMRYNHTHRRRVDDLVVSVVSVTLFAVVLVLSFGRARRNWASLAFLFGLGGLGVSVYLFVLRLARLIQYERGWTDDESTTTFDEGASRVFHWEHVTVPLASTTGNYVESLSAGSGAMMVATETPTSKCPEGFELVGAVCRMRESAVVSCPVNSDAFLLPDGGEACSLVRNTGPFCDQPPDERAAKAACLNSPFFGGCASKGGSKFIGGFFCATSVSPNAKRLSVTQLTTLNGRGADGKIVPRFRFSVSRAEGGRRFVEEASIELRLTVVLRTSIGHIFRRSYLADRAWDGSSPYIITAAFPELASLTDRPTLLVLLHHVPSGEVVAYNEPPLAVVVSQLPNTVGELVVFDAKFDPKLAERDQQHSSGVVAKNGIVSSRRVSDGAHVHTAGFRVPRGNARPIGAYVAVTSSEEDVGGETTKVVVDGPVGDDGVVAFSWTSRTDVAHGHVVYGIYDNSRGDHSTTWEGAIRKSELVVVRF